MYSQLAIRSIDIVDNDSTYT